MRARREGRLDGGLDAFHLASIRVLDAEFGGLEVASCDERVRRNAAALGFAVIP